MKIEDSIDEVYIKISTEASAAASNLDKLSNSISNLELKLQSGMQKANNFVNSINNISKITFNKNNMNTPFEAMQKSMSTINQSAKGNNLASLIKTLDSIPDISNKLDDKEISIFTNKIKQLTEALGPLANELIRVSSSFALLPTNLKKINTTLYSTLKSLKNTKSSSKSIGDAILGLTSGIRFGVIIAGIAGITNTIGKFVNSSNEYIENMNLFKVSMGEMTDEAQKFINTFSETLGVDPSGLMRYMGLFNNLIEGFGIGSKEAYTMSKNLTQLSYDMSSYLNMPVEEAMQKLKSGISGEIEPMRAVGVALDQATLQETAYTLGIDKKVSSMTRAQKTELLYYQIMQKTKNMQGDMARTVLQPANALRILQQQFIQLGRAIGNIFIPILMSLVPYIMVVTQWLTTLAQAIANWLNIKLDFSIPEVDYSGISSDIGGVSDAVDDVGSSADKTSKKLNRMLAKFDELNVIEFDDKTDSGSGTGAGAGAGGGSLGIPLKGYDALKDALKRNFADIEEKLKNILSYVATIGAGLAAWKISQKLIDFFDKFKKIDVKMDFQILGLTLFLSDLDKFRQYFKDFLDNGPTFQNVVGMLSEFVGSIGDIFLMLGKLKFAGALKVIQGIGEIVIAIKDIADSGINWDNATTAIRGLTNVAIGIGLFTKNLKVAGWGAAIQGFTGIIEELAENWEAIKKGDWSGVDKVTLIISGLEILGGLAVAFDAFSKIKGVKNATKAVDNVKSVTNVTKSLDKNVGKLSPKLSSLAKNLGFGILIIGEVIVAAGLIVGAIWGLGKALEQVGLAWEPVLENGSTVISSVLIGTGILIAIGTVTALLGEFGGTKLILPLALGAAILAETGLATGLFVVEIWAIGKALDEIGKAWQPVIDNGGNIALSIGIGTGILVTIGVLAGALGVATAGTSGLLPLAILLGTLMLVELGLATALFVVEIWAIGKGLDEIGKAWQPVIDNGITIIGAIAIGTSILVGIGVVAALLAVAAVATVGLLPLAIALGTAMLIELGLVTGLFVVEIWAIGKGLDEIGKAWQPVIQNGESIIQAIGIGTGLLIGIGTVTAALGVAEVASVGLLPLAIALGTAMLSSLEDALTDFITHLVNVAKQLNDDLYPELVKLNKNLPILTGSLSNYIKFMEIFAGYAVNFSKSSIVSGFASAIDKIISWFKGNPIKDFADEVYKTYQQTYELNIKLRLANPELQIAINLMTQYLNFLEKLEELTGKKNNIELANSMFVNMKEVGKNLVLGFVEGINSKYSSLSNAIKNVLGNALSSKTANSYGTTFGNRLGSSIARALRRTNFPKLKGTINTSGDTATLKFNAYAGGGFPEYGELFLARESGPEMIGEIGNKAAVANNDQIITGIEQGTYRAVSAAMRENNNSRQPVIVKIGEKTIYSGYGSYVDSQSNMYGTNYIRT